MYHFNQYSIQTVDIKHDIIIHLYIHLYIHLSHKM